ncbi:hypothetical protein SERV_ORF93 [short-finned eel virus]|uniref:Uncharacterized protein n=1 Tax=short-finned eel virus TaxID=2848076 RepID=A0A192GQ40_FRG3V|nr:hypothetical protein SERV_ORF93 [Short-finned eel ranavirus]ANK58055.1 hypothetical protein SERV_ORF93 [Short-finned eel ranavirus]
MDKTVLLKTVKRLGSATVRTMTVKTPDPSDYNIGDDSTAGLFTPVDRFVCDPDSDRIIVRKIPPEWTIGNSMRFVHFTKEFTQTFDPSESPSNIVRHTIGKKK